MDDKKVSIIIRTCGRPLVLKNALESIKEQTYKNIEVVVVEDGANDSEQLAMTYADTLDINYYCIGERTGRCHAGNIGLERATGEYLNFLDDDDILLPNHVEVLIREIEKGKFKAVYSIAEEHQIKTESIKTGKFKVKRKLIRYKQPFNKLLLFYMNYIPIQSIMFCRSLYEQWGGFDEELNVLEDWDVWVRYSLVCDFGYIPQVTSIYYTPYKCKTKRRRDIEHQEENQKVLRKYGGYRISQSIYEINRDLDYIVNIFNKKGFLFYMQKIRNFLLYRDR